MATFRDIWPELLGRLPNLDPGYAPKLAQRAWADIRNSRPWSFQMGQGVLFSPVVISSGSVSVTQFSVTVTFDATARAALNGVTNPLLTKRQFRVAGGPPYSIVSASATFSSDGIATLDRPYKETTNAAASYTVFRAYYGAPEVTTFDASFVDTTTETTDFLRYRAIFNPSTGQRLRLYGTQEELNAIDRFRVTSGNPCALFTRSATAAGIPSFEMWPFPLVAQSYLATFQRRGVDLADSDTLPDVISTELLLERAMYHGCLWAEAQKGSVAALKATNWVALAAVHDANYRDRLNEAAVRDEDTMKQNGLYFDDWPLGWGNIQLMPTLNGVNLIW